jgi:hypothetical protein
VPGSGIARTEVLAFVWAAGLIVGGAAWLVSRRPSLL